MLAQDKQVYEDCITGYDVHEYTSQILTNAGQTTSRHNAKPHTFKPLFGGNSGTKAEKAYYKAFREKYHEVYAMQERWVQTVLKTKKLRTVTGLTFYWPDTTVDGNYITNTPSIFNYQIQMFATGDIAPMGTVLLWHHLKALNLKSFIINAVHDSVVLEEAPEESELVGNLMVEAMSKDIVWFFDKLIGFNLNYPMEIETKVNQWWDWNGSEEQKKARTT